MSHTNAGLKIHRDGNFAFVRNDKNLINTNFECGERHFPVLDFFSVPENLELARQIALADQRPLRDQWQSVRAIRAKPDDFFRDLAAAGIVERVPGSIGKRETVQVNGSFGLGEIDHRPGMWLHADLVLPFVQWRSRRNSPTEPTELELFVERALGMDGIEDAKSVARSTSKPVALTFAAEVDRKTLAHLELADAAMIDAGESEQDRTEALQALLKSMRGGRK